MTIFRSIFVLLLNHGCDFPSGPSKKINSDPIKYISFFKTSRLMQRRAFYDKNISYYRTYKLNIIADKMKNRN